MAREGWICPVCSLVLSPDTMTCSHPLDGGLRLGTWERPSCIVGPPDAITYATDGVVAELRQLADRDCECGGTTTQRCVACRAASALNIASSMLRSSLDDIQQGIPE